MLTLCITSFIIFFKELNYFSIAGFFVDINIFKGKEKTSELSDDNDSLLKNMSGSSTSGSALTESLADEDTNLMIKLKFLTYKVSFILCGYFCF